MTLLTLIGVPPLLALLPLRDASSRTRLAAAIGEVFDARLLRALGLRRPARHAASVAVFALLTLASAALIPRIVIDTDYLSFFDEDKPVRRDFDAVNRAARGRDPALRRARRRRAGRLPRARDAARARAPPARGRRRPGVSRTLSLVDTLRVMNRALEHDDPGGGAHPRHARRDRRAAVPRAEGGPRALRERGPQPREPVGAHGRGRLGGDARAGDGARGGDRRGALPDGVHAAVTGNAILLARSADGIAESQPQTVGLAALVIFACWSGSACARSSSA